MFCRPSKPVSRFLLSTILVVAVAPGLAHCQIPAHWIGPSGTGGNGDYSDPANWDINQVPNGNFNVFIDNGFGPSIVSLGSSPSIFNLTISQGDWLNVNNGNSITLNGSQFLNEGLLTLASSGSATSLVVGGPNLHVAGPGGILMLGDFNNRIFGTAPTNRLINDGTIGGNGQLGMDSLEFTNDGVIEANLSGSDLRLDPFSEVINGGVLRARSGATLQLFGGNYQNSGGVIEAQTGSRVWLMEPMLISGGSLQTDGSGVIEYRSTAGSGLTLNGVANAGNLLLDNGTTTNLQGTIGNSGFVKVVSSSNITNVVVDSAVILQGGGIVHMENPGGGAGVLFSGTGQFENLDNTIQGTGTIRVDRFDNRSLVDANSFGKAIWLGGNAGFVLGNSGTLRASNGGILRLISGQVNNQGGVIEALDGSTVGMNAVTIEGGLLRSFGTGKVTVELADFIDITNQATVQVGTNHFGRIDLDGTIVNDGVILLPNSVNYRAVTFGQRVDLSGNGAVKLEGSGRVVGNYPGQSELWNNSTIEGAGIIGGDGQSQGERIINDTGGLIHANLASPLKIEVGQSGEVGFSNSGILRATGDGVLQIKKTNTYGQFQNFSSQTLTGGRYEAVAGGQIKWDDADIRINRAEILLEGANSMIADLTGNNALANLHTNDAVGSLELASGMIQVIHSALANSGQVSVDAGSALILIDQQDNLQDYSQSAGDTRVDGFLNARNTNINGGNLFGNGLVGGALFNLGGNVNPGESIGELTVGQDYIQSGLAGLNIELGGLAGPGVGHDFLNVLGDAYLDGNVNVSFLNGFQPGLGDQFVILETTGSRSGTFSAINSAGPWQFTAVYGTNYVALLTTAIPEPGPGVFVLACAVAGLFFNRRR